MATGTSNPVGSTDPRDLLANAENFDDLLNGVEYQYSDRLGVDRKSWAYIESLTSEITAAVSAPYFFYKTASDIGGYYQMTGDVSAGAPQSFVLSNATGTQTVVTFATDSGAPNRTYISQGFINVHFHAKKTGAGNVTMLAEIYKRASGGTETLLFTTAPTATTLTTSIDEYTISAYVSAITGILADDRIVVKLNSVVASGTPDVTVYVEDAYLSRVEMPFSMSSEIDILKRNCQGAVVIDMGADNYSMTAEESQHQAIFVLNTGTGKTLTLFDSESNPALITIVICSATGVTISCCDGDVTIAALPLATYQLAYTYTTAVQLDYARRDSATGQLIDPIDAALVTTGTIDSARIPTLNQNTTGSAATLTTARTIDGVSFNGSANITVIAPATNAATSKATPVDADEMPIVDSSASNVLKKLTFANMLVWIKTKIFGQGVSSVVYGSYGPTSMTIDGVAYTFTYSSGKIATAAGGGVTKTYTWSGDDLVSVVVS